MNQEEFVRRRTQIIEEDKRFYLDHPEVGAWVQTKKIIYFSIVVFWVFHSALALAVMMQMQTMQAARAGTEIFKLVLQLLILTWSMNPKGGWKLNLFLYFYFFTNLHFLILNGRAILNTLPYILIAPSYSLMLIMEAAAPFLLLGIAIFYTVPAKHRMLSDQSEANMRATSRKIRQLSRDFQQ